jgi:hypothetical protein
MNVLCFSFKSKNKGLSSKSKKDYSMGKRKATIGQTMIYKNKLQRKLKTKKQEQKSGVNSGASEGLNSSCSTSDTQH